MKLVEVSEASVSRGVLTPGMTIKVVCGKRYGPVDVVLQLRGFALLRHLYHQQTLTKTRVFADVSLLGKHGMPGGVHTILIDGPPYRSKITGGRVRPWKVIVPRKVKTRPPKRKQADSDVIE